MAEVVAGSKSFLTILFLIHRIHLLGGGGGGGGGEGGLYIGEL